MFRSCIFFAVSGHVEVKAADYALVVKLDPRAMWLKVCILISRYMGTMQEKFPNGQVPTTQSFEGRKVTSLAQKLRASAILELANDVAATRHLDRSVKGLIDHYQVKNPTQDKVMSARVHMCANIGKLAMKVASALDAGTVKSMNLTSKKMNPEQRREILNATMKDQLHEVEAKYRSALAIAVINLPEPLYPKALRTYVIPSQ